MYNRIGLQTPRGSGTSGYVQKNTACLIKQKDKIKYDYKTDSKPTTLKKPNQFILIHEKKRKVEAQCLEMEELMTQKGYSEAECNTMVSEFRRKLLANLDDTVEIELDEFGRPSTKGSHQLAVAQNKRNEMLRDAFGLDESYDRVSSLSRIPFKKKEDEVPTTPVEPIPVKEEKVKKESKKRDKSKRKVQEQESEETDCSCSDCERDKLNKGSKRRR